MPSVSIPSTGSTLLVASNYDRSVLLISNSDATNNLHVSFGGTASSSDGYIGPGGSMTVTGDVWKGAINAIASAGTITAKYSAGNPGS